MARYNITLPDDVVNAADLKANEMGLSRSAFIASAIQFKIQYDTAMSQLPAMMAFLADLRAGNVSADGSGNLTAPDGAGQGGRA